MTKTNCKKHVKTNKFYILNNISFLGPIIKKNVFLKKNNSWSKKYSGDKSYKLFDSHHCSKKYKIVHKKYIDSIIVQKNNKIIKWLSIISEIK